MNSANLAAVLTTQFKTSDTARTLRSLKSLIQLPLRHIIIVTDEKEPEGRRLAKESQRAMEKEFRIAGLSCEVLSVNCFSTARRWYPGLCRAFDLDHEIHGVLNWLGDSKEDITVAQAAIPKDALQKADPGELILFDYESDDAFKQSVDSLFLLPLVRVVNPELIPAIQGLGHSKLRTELFLVGRDPFSSLRKSMGLSWNTDPTIQLITHSLNNRFKVRSVNIGPINDDPNTRSGAR